jgi:DNA polymerase/3'-5' exonuclease PolX
MNEQLINILTQLLNIYDKIGDEYRAKAYYVAIQNIKKLQYKITKDNLPDLKDKKIPGVGKSILNIITEYITTGHIRELDDLNARKDISAYETLGKISGVGPATISNWVKQKIYTINDLEAAVKANKVTLTHQQQLGLLYYDDLNDRIPRDEVTTIVQKLQPCIVNPAQTTAKNNNKNNTIIFTVAGSYRRGAPSSGDIDILITSIRPIKNYLQLSHACLQKIPGYIDIISAGEQRLTFLFKAQKCRQVDLLYIPYNSYYAALNYFTGSDNFNREIRLIAKSKGYLLNQTGLYKKTPKGMKIIPMNSEKELFDILSIPYKPPNERI